MSLIYNQKMFCGRATSHSALPYHTCVWEKYFVALLVCTDTTTISHPQVIDGGYGGEFYRAWRAQLAVSPDTRSEKEIKHV